MNDRASAESIYDGETVDVKEPENLEPKADEPKAETEPTDTETDEPKGEKPDEENPEQVSSPDLEKPDEPAIVPVSALHGERDRRKAAERERDELKQKLETQPNAEPTSVFEDENGFRSEIQQDSQRFVTHALLEQSRRYANREFGKEKVDEAVAWFEEEAPNSPYLIKQFQESGNDVHEIVDLHQRHQKLEQLKDVDAVEAKMRAELEPKIRAEIEAELKGKAEELDSVPESMAGETSKGGMKGSQWSGPATPESIYDS